MTNADPEEIVTTARNGVAVEKSFEPDDFPVPAIAFTIRSDRETAVSVRLADTVPEDVAPENIGFHPKYGAEFWDVEDGRIVFQRDLAPGEEYTTVYGLRGGDADTAAKFMSEPTIESVDPPQSAGGSDIDAALDAAEIGEVDPSDTVDDGVEIAVSDDSESTDPATDVDVDTAVETDSDVEAETDADAEADLDADTDADPDVDPNTEPDLDAGEVADATESELGDPAEPDDNDEADELIDDDSSPGDSARRETDTVSEEPEHDSLVSQLAAEIEDGAVDDEDLMVLRDALGLDFASASVEARIEHLQSELSDLRAYTDALEAFLDEEGDAQTLIAEARDGYEETADHLEELEGELESLRSELDERLDSIEDTIDERIDAELESIRSDLETLDRQLETETDARSAIEADIERLSEELATVAEMRDRLANALGGLAGGGASDSTASVDADSEGPADGDESDDPADRGVDSENAAGDNDRTRAN